LMHTEESMECVSGVGNGQEKEVENGVPHPPSVITHFFTQEFQIKTLE